VQELLQCCGLAPQVQQLPTDSVEAALTFCLGDRQAALQLLTAAAAQAAGAQAGGPAGGGGQVWLGDACGLAQRMDIAGELRCFSGPRLPAKQQLAGAAGPAPEQGLEVPACGVVLLGRAGPGGRLALQLGPLEAGGRAGEREGTAGLPELLSQLHLAPGGCGQAGGASTALQALGPGTPAVGLDCAAGATTGSSSSERR
jgi:hypothetical protein